MLNIQRKFHSVEINSIIIKKLNKQVRIHLNQGLKELNTQLLALFTLQSGFEQHIVSLLNTH